MGPIEHWCSIGSSITNFLLQMMQRWATATLSIASIPLLLFVKFNSGAAKNSSELSLPLLATAIFAALKKFFRLLLQTYNIF